MDSWSFFCDRGSFEKAHFFIGSQGLNVITATALTTTTLTATTTGVLPCYRPRRHRILRTNKICKTLGPFHGLPGCTRPLTLDALRSRGYARWPPGRNWGLPRESRGLLELRVPRAMACRCGIHVCRISCVCGRRSEGAPSLGRCGVPPVTRGVTLARGVEADFGGVRLRYVLRRPWGCFPRGCYLFRKYCYRIYFVAFFVESNCSLFCCFST